MFIITAEYLKVHKIFKQALLSVALLLPALITPSFAGVLEITTFGHSAVLIKGGGHSVLLNPFKAIGCASGLEEPNVGADIVLASSNLPDEGFWKRQGVFFVKPGSYRINGLQLEGFSTAHDRLGGRRFGDATFWQWDQGGLNFAHLGGIAGPLDEEEKLLLGRPDVLFIGVGGGAKVYNAQEALEVINALNPKVVIPVQFVKGKAPKNCDQTGIQPFLEATKSIKHRKVGKMFMIPSKLPEETIILIP